MHLLARVHAFADVVGEEHGAAPFRMTLEIAWSRRSIIPRDLFALVLRGECSQSDRLCPLLDAAGQAQIIGPDIENIANAKKRGVRTGINLEPSGQTIEAHVS